MQTSFKATVQSSAAETVTSALSLYPLLAPSIASVLEENPMGLRDLVTQYGSPLNIVWPHLLKENFTALRKVLDEQRVKHQFFYAAKVNKSQSLVKAAVELGLGVDVSSLYELNDALRFGADNAGICGTGPAKTDSFLSALVAHDALISIDSPEELNVLDNHLSQIPQIVKPRVSLRFRPSGAETSRFGMGADQLADCLAHLAGKPHQYSFEGFHFHLSGYSPDNRVQALAELTAYVDKARNLGLAPRMIDIGGGLPIQYVDSSNYDAFLAAQDASHYRNGRVPDSFYPYGGRLNATTWLRQFLASLCDSKRSVADYFRQEGLILGLEPGRSLVDQAAITAFRITRVKTLPDGKNVIFVEGSSFSACETWFNSEFLVDPIHLPQEPKQANDDVPFHAYIAGQSCLDEDIVTNRLIAFQSKPQTGDLLIYANTAGYQMDLLENEFHRVPMPRRIAVNSDLTTVVADDISGEAE